jgi:hypothetical protein
MSPLAASLLLAGEVLVELDEVVGRGHQPPLGPAAALPRLAKRVKPRLCFRPPKIGSMSWPHCL